VHRSFLAGSQIVAVAAALLLISAHAGAAPDEASAEAHFRAGRAALAQGNYAEACARFSESQRLDPAPGTLLNLGECKQRLGLFASAWEHYTAASALLGVDPRKELAKQKLMEIEPQLSRLTLVLAPGSAAGAIVTRDGTVLREGELGVAVRLDRGEHRVVVSAPGHAPRTFTLDLPTAESRTLLVEPGPSLTAPRASGLRTVGIVVGTAGLASLGVGVAAGLLTMQRQRTVEAHCVNQLCDPEGVSAASQGKTWSAVSTATFAAGLAGIGAGVVMVVVGGPRAQASAGLSLGPDRAGIAVSGAF
jgi:hypothetical protein